MTWQSGAGYYEDNRAYALFLESHSFDLHAKYYEHIVAACPKRALDAGCGVGQVVNRAAANGFFMVGSDISSTFLVTAQHGPGIFVQQPPAAFPFRDASFDVVGSFTVLEHVQDPDLYLDELVRVLEPAGRIILACPNFLSITNSYHWHTAGLWRKAQNLGTIVQKVYASWFQQDKLALEFMRPRLGGPSFAPDDDAICMTNPIDVQFQLRKRGITILYTSSVLQPAAWSLVNRIRDMPLLKLLFGAVFVEGRKGAP